MKPTLLALDWGSSQLRAWRVGDDGTVLDERCSADGASRLARDPAVFENALRRLAGDWIDADPGLPIVACGMVGSAHGWREAPYAACPVVLADLPRHAVTVDGSRGLRLTLIPGLRHAAPGTPPDVMRGEETQLAGLIEREPALAQSACVVMPGTHSKWVELDDGRVQRFATRMTGELFALLREHSVLGRLMRASAAFDRTAFDRGVAAALENDGADVTRLLFSVRTLGLFGELPGEALADYLSGLLIGAEVACGLRDAAPGVPLALVGEAALCKRYSLALAAAGRDAQHGGEHLAAAGLWRFAAGR